MKIDGNKLLSEFDQQDINQLSDEFDLVIETLQLIYLDLVKFNAPRLDINLKKSIYSRITRDIVSVEESNTYNAILVIFGINYEFSNKKPKFLEVCKGINPSCNPILPWSHFTGHLYQDVVEKKFLDIQKSKPLRITQGHDYKKFIKIVPNDFTCIFDRLKDPTRSARANELLQIYMALSLAKDFDEKNKIETFSVKNGALVKDSEGEFDALNEVKELLKKYFDELSRYVDEKDYQEPSNDNLNWNDLIQKCVIYRDILLKIAEKECHIISIFEKGEKDLFALEMFDLLEANDLNVEIYPSSTDLNKLPGGSVLVRKLGLTDGKYRGFEKFYRDWVDDYLKQRMEVKSNQPQGTNKEFFPG